MSINTLVEFVSALKKNPVGAVEAACKIHGVGYKGDLHAEGAKYILIRNATYDIDLRTELARYCNGMIVDLEERSIVSLPPPKLRNKFDLKRVINSLDQYKAYPARDGSVVTLYHADGWKISSAQGFDVTGMSWLGESTFGQAVAECLAGVPGFSFGRLNTDYCYSIGFSHPDFHPNTPRLDLWFIQKVNLVALIECLARNTARDIECVDEKNAQIIDFIEYEDDVLPAQQQIEVTLPLLEACESALGDYLRNPNEKPVYGIVFRGNCGAYSNLLHESSLMTALRRLIYNMPKAQWMPKTPSKRISYAILRAALSQERWTFASLFPQYAEEIRKTDTAISRMSHRIVHNLVRGVSPESSTALEQTTAQIQAKVSSHKGIDLTNDDASLIVEDLIRDVNNLAPLFRGLVC